ncbi:MAG: LURP-one-related family protein [Clostridia bacterium]|nr:LURP-one-related family protein [Clostridia bacterium]
MKLYIKQHVFTWGDRFSIYDEAGNEKYFVEGEVFTLGKKLHLMDLVGNELAFIYQKLFSFLPRYYINRNGHDLAEVVKHFTFFSQEYSVEGLGWSVTGDFFAHDYQIAGGGSLIASVYKEWFTWGDAYAIEINPGIDEIAVLAVVLIIDAVISDSNN